MNAEEINSDDDVIVAEELPQQLRVAEGSGDQGEWVAWAGGDRKLVRIIALDDEAFYAKAVKFDQAVAFMQQLRAGSPPNVVLAKSRQFPVDELRDLRIEEQSGQISIFNPLPFRRRPVWSQGRFAVAVQHDLLHELSRRLPDATRWHKSPSSRRAVLGPLGLALFFGLMLVGLFIFDEPDSRGSAARATAPTHSAEQRSDRIGPTGMLVFYGVFFLGCCVWAIRTFRNPPVYAGIKPKVNFWGKGRKQSTG